MSATIPVSVRLFSYAPSSLIGHCSRCGGEKLRFSSIRSALTNCTRNEVGVRCLSTSTSLKVNLPRITVETSEAVKDLFDDPEFKPRKGPGHFHVKKVCLPPKLKSAAETMIKVQSIGNLESSGSELHNRLKNRKPPIEEDDYKAKAAEAETHIKGKHAYMDPFLSEEQKKKLENSDFQKIKHRLKRTVYHWEPIEFTKTVAYNYLVGRTPGEYAALYRIFFELANRDPEFKPETLLDFGSGVGSVIWSANQFWKKSLTEHMCIDSSEEMLTLAELLLRGGASKYNMEYPGIYFRRLLPTSTHRKYDMTVSSYTLLELSSLKERIEAIDILWKKTNKYMVLVEMGTNAGFRVLNEAREYILQLHDYETEDEENLLDFETGHVFSPCPHELPCPRISTDNTPCNFSIRYEALMPFSRHQEGVEVFSYLVFKKGSRKKTDLGWPRVVREPLLRPRHVICRLCTKYGNISETVITKGKHSRKLYRTARTSFCGDLLPVDEVQANAGPNLDFTEVETNENDSDSDDGPASTGIEEPNKQ